MNAKDKAEELIKKFIPFANSPDGETNWINANQCAIIAVKELIEEHTWKNPISWNLTRLKTWNEVLTELERMLYDY